MRSHRSGTSSPQHRTLIFESLEIRRVLTRLFDIDGDDDLDVLSDLVWYENTDGYGNFRQHVISEISAPDSVAVDFDGDGDLDILTREPKWYENDGDNRFPVAHDFPGEGSQFTELELFDVGGDGDVDIIAFTGRRERAYFYENRDGTFVEATTKD